MNSQGLVRAQATADWGAGTLRKNAQGRGTGGSGHGDNGSW